ncbi:hypothetical protein LshimejAT787_1201490 [Lyophyllum shimeji]|uniref:Uncharacterized protein n=1 Tax=Lyophyllum shimeji TaxID=47721 RepID=A0A9P3USP0_LYOSH|nr:hypothetical protein LshimejAT787_1201490 [Lyophyllum shimeji]
MAMLYTHTHPALTADDASESTSFPIAGSIPSLPIILTASVVLLAVDATITLFRRRTIPSPTLIAAEPVTTPAAADDDPPPACRSLTRFVDKTRSILADVQALEKQLASSKAFRARLSLSSQHHLPSTTPKPKPKTTTTTTTTNTRRAAPSCAFSAFCDRLLLTNRIWKQERELSALRASLASSTKRSRATAFHTFCEQLLLHNRIWQLERAAAALREENARVRREREKAVTRAARRMVCDVQKERMVEEFVKDLIGEVKSERERCEREVRGQWVGEYRRVREEVERMRVAREARMVEQEVGNELEERLVQRVREAEGRVRELEERLARYVEEDEDEVTLNGADGGCEAGVREDDEDATEVETDTISELSTSSTCVSSGGSIKRPSTSSPGLPPRRRCISHGTGKTLQGPTSAALKPLMIDQAKAVSTLSANLAVATRTCNHSGRPLAVRNRTTSVIVRSPTAGSGSGSSTRSGSRLGTLKVDTRPPWRV